jgi:Fatty acid hydroxylase superfamily
MESTILLFAASFGGGVIFASFFEWTLHRYVMHRPVGKFDYAFKAHAIVHHHVFKADRTYHLINEQDKETIPMAWWNGPVIVLLNSIPAGLVAWWVGSWMVVIGTVSAFCLYFAAYEYTHWCMHLPKARRVEKSWLFYRLNGHHLLHHRYMHKNFNVVLPLADLLLGTLLLRSKIKFPQAQGPAVPDVQPHQRPADASA